MRPVLYIWLIATVMQSRTSFNAPTTAIRRTWHWFPRGNCIYGVRVVGEIINSLTGIPCGVEMHTVDANRDSITDLVASGYLRQGGVPTALSGTYSVHRRRSDGTWEVFDTNLAISLNPGRVI